MRVGKGERNEVVNTLFYFRSKRGLNGGISAAGCYVVESHCWGPKPLLLRRLHAAIVCAIIEEREEEYNSDSSSD